MSPAGFSGLNFRRVVVLAPHADDAELGCGGTIAKLIEEGSEVLLVAFSTPAGAPRHVLESEAHNARGVMEISEENLILYNYEVRTMPQHRQDILDRLYKMNTELQPDLILLPSLSDLHQDHTTVAMEGLRAFKMRSILGYELPWNHLSFHTAAFVPLEERHLERKIMASKSYLSQMGRQFFDEEVLRGLARTRGCQIGVKYAEAFEVLRWIIK